MKLIVLAGCLLAAIQSFGKVQVLDGVPFRCLGPAQSYLISTWAKENSDDAQGLKDYRKFILEEAPIACRSRKNPSIEYFTWCDGSGCSGVTATMTSKGCVLSDQWSGQDDQDYIDENEWKESCLIDADFKR